jgi:Tol biopolymer transport system component
MKVLRILGLVVMAGLAACDGLEGIDIGDGGGGGTGGGSFSRGFAFIRGTDRNVYAVDDVTGNPNNPLRLTQSGGAYEPAVSRNGRLVAFVYKMGSTLELRTVPTTGQGQPSTVFSSTNPACSGCTLFRAPTFSPDNTTIVFTVYRSGTSVLAKVSTSGSGFQFLPTGGYSNFGSASFYPDGLNVLATAGSLNQPSTLLKVPVNGGTVNPIASSLGNEALWVVSRAAVSPDGSKVAFDGRISSGGSRIFVAPLGQTLGSVTMVTDYPGESGVEDRYPSWRGNTELGFVSNYGSNENIYRIGVSSLRGSGNLMVPSALEPSYGG